MKPSTDLFARTAAIVPARTGPASPSSPGASGAGPLAKLAPVGEEVARSPAASAHQEKVTLSEEAQVAARELPPAARGEVRWYRATGVGRAGPLDGSDVPAARAAVAAQTAPRPARVANPRSAVAAYAGAMAEALAAA